MRTTAPPGVDRLLTRDFMIVTISGFFALAGFASTLPLVPRYVEGELGGGKIAVGVAVGIFSVTAVFARPFIGKLGDERGRRFIIVFGTSATAVIVAAHALATTLPLLYAIRLAMGVTQGAFFVGTATLVNDLAPPERRGEATNYFSVAVYGGMAFGPALGEMVQRSYGFGWAFTAGGASLAVAAMLATLLPARVPRPSGAGPASVVTGNRLSRMLYLPALAPGFVLMMGIVTFTALNGFMPLYVEEFDLGSAGGILMAYGLLVLVMRVIGSKIPDRWGTRRTAVVSLLGQVAGMAVMGVWNSTLGVYVGAAVLAVGGSFLYPALLTAAIYNVPDDARARATSTFSVAFELSSGIGGPVLGVAAALGGTRWAFFAAAAFAAAGIPLLFEWARRRPGAMIPPRVAG
ncbi:MAG: MFS transporter [Actinomycetia bacterium]|nr:MFS transporter [Actinomycetes bacterium]